MATTNQSINVKAVVGEVSGEAVVRRPDGTIVPLKQGMQLNIGDVVITGPGAHAQIILPDGAGIVCGKPNGDSVVIDRTVLDVFANSNEPHSIKAEDTEVFQRVIQDGGDVSLVMKSTAAGNEAGGDAGGGDTASGNSYVVLQRISTVTLPATFSNANDQGTPPTQSVQLSLPLQTAPLDMLLQFVEPNTPPVVNALSSITTETDSTFQVDLLGGAKDSNGDRLSVRDITFSIDSGLLPDGGVSIAADGSNISVDPSRFSFLAQGEVRFITVTYFVSDGVSKTSNTLTIKVVGTNDIPTIDAGTGSVTEDFGVTAGMISTGGTLNISDADAGQSNFVVQTGTAGNYGVFSLASNGVWTYVADNSQAAIQQLGAGDTLTETFTVTSADGTTSTVTVTIYGTNDVPVISSGAGSVSEDFTLTTSGTLTITDTDAGEAAFIAQTNNASPYGTFVIDASGHWSFVLNNGSSAVQMLNAGQVVTQVFTVASVDGTLSSVTVTITGTEDVATLTSDSKALTESNAVLSTGGTLTLADLDATDATVVPQSGTAGTYGSFAIDAAGVWTYTTSSAQNQLNAGQVVTETFNVATTDGGTASVTVTITGSEDVATLTSDSKALTESNAVLSTGGTLTLADLDATDATVVPQSGTTGTYGSFAIDAAGVWTYTTSSAQNQLNAGQVVTETFNVATTDGGTASVTVTITGSEDVATLTSDSKALTESNAVLSTGGTLTLADLDATDATVVPQSGTAGTYGSFAIDAAGVWTYTTSSAQNQLNAGQVVTETFNVATTDGGTASVTVTITGSEDVATLTSDSKALTESNAVLSTGGTLTLADLDATDATVVPQSGTAGTYGSFTIDAAGVWTYATSSAQNQLNAGQVVTETFNVATTDGGTASVTVTITGTNDLPVIAAASGAVTEDVGVVGGNLSTGGTIGITDADAGEAHFIAQNATSGAYGTFTLASNGAWTYVADNSQTAIQELGTGGTLTEQFTISSADGTTSTVNVTIHGTNDVAVLSADTRAITEDVAVSAGKIATGGTLTVTDVDAGEDYFIPQAATAGAYGTFTLASNGNWAYSASNSQSAIQQLGAGDTLTETFTVASEDGTTSTVTITINGTNDVPVISSGTGSVTEDSALTTSGTLTISDTDAGESVFAAQAGTTGSYGTFTIDAAGHWTYTLDNSNAAVQALGAGQTLTETYAVASADGTASSVTITINGTNDAAVLSAGTGSVTEDTTLTTSGTLTISDTDTGQASFVAQTGTAGTYGNFSIDSSGHWSFSLNNANATVQALGVGDTLTQTFNVSSVDGTTTTVTITINGTNDVPVISSGTGSVTEDSALTTSGTLTISDTDAGESVFAAQAGTTGSYGTFTIDAAGHWTYTLDNSNAAVQALGAGQTLTETYAVASADGTASSVTITINGTNDAAVLSAGTGSVTEDTTLTTSGTLTISDTDTGQASFVAQTGTAGTYGNFSIDSSGHWSFSLNNANATVQALGVGDTLTQTFNVSSVDGTTTTVTITINGTNDVPVISSGTGSVTEDSALTTSGTLTISDTDAGESVFAAQAGTTGSYGTFTIDAAGHWTYTLDNSNAAVQALGAGQTLTETYAVASADGTASSVTITINGTNDAAVLSAGTGSVTEDTTLTTSGTLTISDTDTGQSTFVAQIATVGTYGTFNIAANGQWSYVLDNDNPVVIALGAGDSRTEVFTVTSVDGTPTTVTITVNGTNDSAVLSSGLGSVTEDTVLTTSGTLLISDVDANQNHFNAQTGTTGSYGTFTIDTAGYWTFTLDNTNATVQALGAGQAITEVYNVTSADGTPTTVTVLIHGTNDLPVLSSGTGSVTEDTTLTTSGTLTISDTDAGQSTFVAQIATAGSYGTFTIDAAGHWSFSLNNANATVQALGVGDTLTQTFNVSSVDGTTTTVTITINGTNDVPVISAGTGSVTEDSALTTSGTLTISDTDAGESVFAAQAGTTGSYGTFTIDAAGHWTYTLDNSNAAVQALGAGQTLTETYAVASADGTASSVTITINGTNDAAVLSAGTGSVTEDTTLTTSGTLTISDTDTGQASFVAQTGTAGTYGNFSIDSSGHWSFSLNNANATVQALGVGDTLTQTFNVSSVDGTTTTVTITINGTNDVPVISSGTGSVTEDSALTTSGTLTISDTDAGESVFAAQAGTTGSYGTFTIDAAGHWTYTLDNSNAAVQALGAGQTLTETYAVASADGTASSVTITINGTNDAAVLSAGTGSVTEDTTLTTSGTLTISDTDTGQASFVAQTGTAGTYGNFSIDSSGHWSFSLNNANATVQALGVGDTLTQTFNVSSVDGTTTTVTITINGTNDVPVISAGTGSVTEDVVDASGNLTTGGALTITDVDTGEDYFVAQPATTGTYGTFTLASDGTWTYTADNSQAAIDALGLGDTLTEVFTVTAADGTTSTVTVTIIGTNESATISTGVGAVTEDVNVSSGNIATSGTLTIVDTDLGEAYFLPQHATAGAYGTFRLASDGSWTYTADNSQAAIQELNSGSTLSETFVVTSADGSTSSVTVTITGTEDIATLTSDSKTLTESNAVLSTGGTLTLTDVDAIDATVVPQSGTSGSYGTFAIDAAGQWTYVTSSAHNQLSAGQVVTETFSVATTDGGAATVTVTITGTDDASVLVSDSKTINEDSVATGNVLTNDSDVDNSLSVSSFSIAGQSGPFTIGSTYSISGMGTFNLASNGSYTFTPAANWNGSVPQVTYTTNTGSSSTLDITVNAVDDSFTDASESITVAEDSGTTTGSLLTGTTSVDGPVSIAGFSISGQSGPFTLGNAYTISGVGTVTINSDGSYSFTPATNYNGNVPAISYSVTDGSGSNVSSTLNITVTAVDDASVLVADTNTVNEDNVATGNVLTNDSDVDNSLSVASFTVNGTTYTAGATAQTIAGVGTLVLNTDGSYTFTPNANWNGSVPQVTYTTNTGSSSTLNITVTAVNDAPVGVADTATAVEAGGVSNATAGTNPTGNVLTNDTDVDTGDSKAVSAVTGASAGTVGGSTAGTYGSLVLNSNGSYTYTVDNNNATVQALRTTGNTLTDTFTYTVRDAAGATSTATLTVTVQGANDAPVAVANTGAVNENATLTVNAASGVLANDTDVDSGDTKTVSAISFGASSGTVGSALTGTYGTLTLNADGSYSYSANTTAANALPAGTTATDAFTYTVRDTAGATSTATLTLTVTGQNDAPVISASSGSVTEDTSVTAGNLTTSGTVAITDADTGEAAFIAQSGTAGTYGTFTLASNGGWTYTASNSQTAVQQLNAGQTLSETFTVTSADGTTSNVTVTINGTNDVATLTSDSKSLTETNAVLSTGGTLSLSDVDATDATVVAQTGTSGTYGTFAIDAAGQWTYVTSSAQNQLNAGQVVTETFSVATTDGGAATVTVTITGTNDVATLTSDSKALTETNAVLSTGGTLTLTDLDATDATVVPQASTAGTYGTFAIDASGNWTYVTSSAQNQLNAGQVVTETFNVATTDGGTATVTVTITGTEDIATLTSDSKTLTESNAVLSTGGTLTLTDVDAIDATVVPQSGTSGSYGTFAIDAAGQWTYVTSSAHNQLSAGQVVTETFSVATTDGGAATVTVTITGTDDASVLVSDSKTINEDSVATGNVLTNDSDVDNTLSVSSFSIAGQSGPFTIGSTYSISGMGTFNLASNGSYTFTPAANWNGSVPQVTYTTNTGSSSTLDITVNAVDDSFTDASESITVAEDSGTTTGSLLTGTTSVDGPVSIAGFSISGQSGPFTLGNAYTISGVGTVTINSDGSYSFTPATNYNGNVPAISYSVTDGSGSNVSSTLNITVTAVDDASVLVADTNTVNEDNVATGNVLTNDSDVDNSLSVASFTVNGTTYTAGATVQTIAGVGTLVLNTDGSYTFTPNANWNGSVPQVTYTTNTGSSSTLNITVTAVDDASVLVADTKTVNEDNVATGNVLTNDSDVDNSLSVASFTVNGTTYTAGATAQTIAGVGTLVLNTDGSYTFTPNANWNGSVPQVTYTTNTGSSSTLNITVTAVDDASVLVADTNTVNEDNVATGNVLTNDSDVDNSLSVASFTVNGTTYTAGATAQTIAGVGTLVLNTDGSYTFTPNANWNGSVPQVTYTTNTGSSSTLNITVTAVNDAPVGVADTATAVEAGGVSNATAGTNPTGNVLTNDTDVDTGDTKAVSAVTGASAGTVGGSTAGTYGSLVLNSNGSYTYTVDNNNATVQALRTTGNTLTDTFTYTVRDAAGATSTATLTVTVQGANDAPVAVANTGAVNENATLTVNAASGVLANDTDVDSGDTKTVSAISFGASSGTVGSALTGTYGTLTLNADGSYSYSANTTAANALPAGTTATDAFTYTVRDTAGATSTATLTLTVTGQNDAPVISASSGSVTEDTSVTAGNLTTSGTVAITDADTGEAAFIAQSGTAGTYGTFTLASNGGWTYTADNSQTAVQQLNAGQTLSETFTVTSADGTTSNVTVTINGANDYVYASISANPLTAVTEQGGQIVFTVTLKDAAGNLVTVPNGSSATVNLSWSGTASAADIDSRPSSVTISGGASSASFTVTAVDDYLKESTDETLTATITGGSGSFGIYTGLQVDGANSAATGSIFDETKDDNALDPETYDNNDLVTLQLVSVDAGGNIINGGTANTALEGGNAYYKVIALDAAGNNVTSAISGTVSVTFTAGTATLTADYTPSKTTGIALGEVFNASIATDALTEGTENFSVALNSGSFNNSALYEKIAYAGTVTTSVADKIGVTSVTVSEETDQYAVFSVTTASSITGSVALSLVAGTATSGVDFGSTIQYSLNNGATWVTGNAFTAPTGGGTTLVRVAITDDALVDSGEQFSLTATSGALSSTGTATIVDATANDDFGAGIMTDNDTAYTFKLIAVDASGNLIANSTVGEEAADKNAYYKVIAVDASGNALASQPTGTVTVAVGAPTDSATPGSDYTSDMRREVTVGSVFSVAVTDDAQPDSNETFSVNLVAGSYSLAETYEAIDYNTTGVTTTITDTDTNPAVPVAKPYSISMVEGSTGSTTVVSQSSNTNLMLVLDVSGSMGTTVTTGMTRLDYAKQAAVALINAYDGYGDVSVQVIKFSSTATNGSAGVWMSASQAITYINSLTAGGYTNYDKALDTAMTVNFNGSGAQTTGMNVSYFLSDGNPTQDSAGKTNVSFNLTPGTTTYEAQDIGLQSGEEWAWKNYLNSNEIVSYAYGIGTGVNTAYLNPVAWNGGTVSDMSAVQIADISQLATSLTSNIAPPVPTFYNLLEQAAADAGPDGWLSPTSKLVSVAYNGTTYTFDATHTQYTITLSTGSLTIKNTGEYSLTPASGLDVKTDLSSVLSYTISDANGDTASSTFTISITDRSEVVATDNYNQAVLTSSTNTVSSLLTNFTSGGSWSLFPTSTPGSSSTVVTLDTNITTAGHVGDVLYASNTTWGLTTMGNGTSGDGRATTNSFTNNTTNMLRLTDDGGVAATGAQVSTPTVTIASGSTATINFDAGFTQWSTGDTGTWAVYMQDASGVWSLVTTSNGGVSGGTYSGNVTATAATTQPVTYTTGSLTAGTYRMLFSVNESSTSTSTGSSARLWLDNFNLNTTTTTTTTSAVTGNVVTDTNNLVSSTDAWGAVDSKGSEGATLSHVNGVAWASLTASASGTYTSAAGYKQVVGSYGTLYIKTDGAYAFVASTNSSNVGLQDTYSYTLTQPDGDADTANLVIGIASSALSNPTPITGTTGADTLTGTSADNVILGNEGDDTISGGAGNDHIEGGLGNDTLSGDAGNDVIIGGLGNDVINGGAGADILIGGDGIDTYVFTQASDSVPVINNPGTGATLSGYDLISDFTPANGTLQSEFLSLPGAASIVADGTVNGTNATFNYSGTTTIGAHTVSHGLISFTDSAGAAVTLDSNAKLSAALDYLQHNDLGNAGATVAFKVTMSGVTDTYVYSQDTTNAGGNSALVKLAGVDAAGLTLDPTLTTQGYILID